MVRSSLLLTLALCSVGLTASETAPWTDTFTMTVSGQERTFVAYKDETWMKVSNAEVAAGQLATDVAFVAKVQSTPARGGKIALYGMSGLELLGPNELWNGVLTEDNVHVLAHATGGPTPRLLIKAVIAAPGDREIIAQHLAGAGATDWDARLAQCRWIREQAGVQGNRDFWINQADQAVVQLAADAVIAASATAAKDVALLERAMTWCLDELKDPARAADVATQPWLAATDPAAAERIALRLRALGFAPYRGRWYLKSEALTREYDDRWAAVGASDAEGYFRLSRWADAQGDQLTRYKELVYRALQAGLGADNRHPGIRRELGLSPLGPETDRRPTSTQVLGNAGASAPTEPSEIVNTSGIRIPTPVGWATTLNGADYLLSSPDLPKAEIGVRFLPGVSDLHALFHEDLTRMAQLEGYRVITADATQSSPTRTMRSVTYSTVVDSHDATFRLIVVSFPGCDTVTRLMITAGDKPEAGLAGAEQMLAGMRFDKP